ncbi:MAG: endoglucanase [Pseudomonadota bacterium]
MEINSSLIPSPSNLTVELQSGRADSVQRSLEPVQTLTHRAVTDSKQADALLMRFRSRQAVQQNQMSNDLRSQRALSAYQSLEQGAERDYVSAVLGIDEYV